VQLICLYMSALKDLLVDLAYTYPWWLQCCYSLQ
jgi:hypothetical protein